MFSHLKKYSKILVSGPQRSGTTICTKMISHDTGHIYLDQSHLEGSDSVQALKKIYNTRRNFVIQTTGEAQVIEQFSAKDTLIIFMIRPISAIIRSEIANKWSGDGVKKLYGLSGDPRPASVIKYERWEKQKEQIINWLEIKYSSLSKHPLFIPRRKRKGWKIRQISELTTPKIPKVERFISGTYWRLRKI